MTRHRAIHRTVLCASLVCMGIAPHAQAQQRGTATGGAPRWEVDAHIGGGNNSLPSNGTATPIPPSSSFLTLANRTSLHIPSWFVGEGSQLFNSFPSSVRVGTTITPLDPALVAAAGGRAGIVVGARLARALTNRFRVEFTLDYSNRTSALPAIARSAAEESRASFERAFTAFFTAPGSPWAFPSVRSTIEARDRGNGQVVALGAVLVRLKPGRWSPFVAAGGGVTSMVGEAPHVSLTGEYEMQFSTLGTFRETDIATLSYELSKTIPVFTLGGGVTYEVSRRMGLRVELRGLFGRTTATTRLRMVPDIEQRVPPFVVALHPPQGHGVQFSNNTTISGRESSLGPLSRDWETFRASGSVRQINATGGWYWRF